MLKEPDSFCIDLALRHPSRDARSISIALSLEPFPNWGSGHPERRTFYARLQVGNITSDYGIALAKVATWLDDHAEYFTDFVESGGKVELLLNHAIGPMEKPGDKCFEIRLEPELLQQLSSKGVALGIQGWQAQ